MTKPKRPDGRKAPPIPRLLTTRISTVASPREYVFSMRLSQREHTLLSRLSDDYGGIGKAAVIRMLLSKEKKELEDRLAERAAKAGVERKKDALGRFRDGVGA